MYRVTALNRIAEVIGARRYLEIGLMWGDVILNVTVGRKVGVDPVMRIARSRKLRAALRSQDNWRIRYHETTSDDYFAARSQNSGEQPFDLAFIDGLHTYDQVLRDTLNAEAALSPRGIIVLHDCNPVTPAAETPAHSPEEAKAKGRPGWNGSWNGDVWKAVLHLRLTRPDLRIFVLDCDEGLGVIARVGPAQPTPPPIDVASIADLGYDDLDSNRESFLNLRPPEYLDEFLGHAPLP